jgi:NAD dependent epimerase/dehydratase
MNWNNKRVLVTGAGGFIGSHLTERLVELGAQVRAFVHYNALGSRGWLDESPFKRDIECFAGDVCDRDSVGHAMRDREIVFHLAALIGIPYSYHAPSSYVRTNIEGTLNVLQAAFAQGVEMFLHTSTSEVYGTAQYVPIDEGHPLQGQSPYSASKIGADKMAEAFHKTFNMPLITVRPFNAFGPRQSARAIVPTILTQLLAGESVHLGNLAPTRDLNFVSNTVDGFVLAASTPGAIGLTVNLGSGREISVGDLARLMAGLLGKAIQVEMDESRLRPKKSEVERLVANSQLARTLLGWEPRVDLESGLRKTIAWFQGHQERYRTDGYVL